MEGMAASRKGIKDFKSNMQMIRAELSLGEWERFRCFGCVPRREQWKYWTKYDEASRKGLLKKWWTTSREVGDDIKMVGGMEELQHRV